jgi:hypothetical protein
VCVCVCVCVSVYVCRAVQCRAKYVHTHKCVPCRAMARRTYIHVYVCRAVSYIYTRKCIYIQHGMARHGIHVVYIFGAALHGTAHIYWLHKFHLPHPTSGWTQTSNFIYLPGSLSFSLLPPQPLLKLSHTHTNTRARTHTTLACTNARARSLPLYLPPLSLSLSRARSVFFSEYSQKIKRGVEAIEPVLDKLLKTCAKKAPQLVRDELSVLPLARLAAWVPAEQWVRPVEEWEGVDKSYNESSALRSLAAHLLVCVCVCVDCDGVLAHVHTCRCSCAASQRTTHARTHAHTHTHTHRRTCVYCYYRICLCVCIIVIEYLWLTYVRVMMR